MELHTSTHSGGLHFKGPRSLTISDTDNKIKYCPDGAPHILTLRGVILGVLGFISPFNWSHIKF